MAVSEAYGDSTTYFRTPVGAQSPLSDMTDAELRDIEYAASSSDDPQVRVNGDNARSELARRSRSGLRV